MYQQKTKSGKLSLMLRDGKSGGPDGIKAEALKVGISMLTNMFYVIIEEIVVKDEITGEWKECSFGQTREHKNYAGIMFLSVPGKVLNRVILERLEMALKSKEPPGRLPSGKIMHRPDSSTSHYNRTVCRMELSCLR